MSDPLDMTAMYAMHGALRRELEHLARIATRIDGDPATLLRTAAGWKLFTTSLHVHHTAEDDALWPALRHTLAERPDDLALLEAMEVEHRHRSGHRSHRRGTGRSRLRTGPAR